jgi:hypothetical protein
MYLFGGSSNFEENNDFYRLNLKTFKWDLLTSFDFESPFGPREGHTSIINKETA